MPILVKGSGGGIVYRSSRLFNTFSRTGEYKDTYDGVYIPTGAIGYIPLDDIVEILLFKGSGTISSLEKDLVVWCRVHRSTTSSLAYSGEYIRLLGSGDSRELNTASVSSANALYESYSDSVLVKADGMKFAGYYDAYVSYLV